MFHGDALALLEQDGVLLVELQHDGRLLLILAGEFIDEALRDPLVVEGEDERAHQFSLHVLDLYLFDLLEQEADVAGQVVGCLIACFLVYHTCEFEGAIGDDLFGGAELVFGLDELAVHILAAIKLGERGSYIRYNSMPQ